MAVKVIRSLVKRTTDSDGEPVVEQYPDATSIEVREGHLEVNTRTSGGSRRTRAVYAPGEWKWAEVIDQQ